MQKCLRLMLALCEAHVNFRLDVVLNDVTGKSGQAIIKATAYFVHSTSIISGERDPHVCLRPVQAKVGCFS